MLLPRNLLQAAEADITRSGRNHGHRGGMYEHYAFHRAHVRKANSARELVALAAAEPRMGLGSGKKWTRTIYGDAELLKQAASIAKGA